MANNLFYFDRSDLSTYVNIGPNTAPDTFTFSHNLWYAHNNPAQSQPNLPVTETNGMVGQNPHLVDPASGDYHLQANSPAIGQGAPVAGVVTDYDGVAYETPPSIGAFEFQPDLVLNGRGGHEVIHLSWTLNVILPAAGTWQIIYTPDDGLQSSPITGIISSTRSYTLTGLTNYQTYTITLNAPDNTTPILTDTIHAVPTDRLIYLPLVLKQ